MEITLTEIKQVLAGRPEIKEFLDLLKNGIQVNQADLEAKLKDRSIDPHLIAAISLFITQTAHISQNCEASNPGKGSTANLKQGKEDLL